MMKRKANITLNIILLLIFSITTIACGKQPEPDWISNFVVFEGALYEVTEQEVDQIEKQIGRIDKLISDSAIHSGNISNKYPKDTLLYQISNVDVKKSIAVEVSMGEYLQANYKSKYVK